MSHLPGLGAIWGVFVPLVFAATTQTLTVSDIPTTLDQNQETQVTVNLTCPSCSTDSYLRGVFYPSGTSYFGYTQGNDGTWTNAPGGSCTQYYKVLQTDVSKEGTWSGVLKIKSDAASPYYNGPGEYLFKVGRYTPSCSSASVWSGEVTIAITGPTRTPTPMPSATQAPTNAPNPTVTNTPAPTQPAGGTPSASSQAGGTPTPTDTMNPDILGESVASGSTEEADMGRGESDEASVAGSTNGRSPFIVSFLIIGVGLALLSVALAWQKTDVWKKLVNH